MMKFIASGTGCGIVVVVAFTAGISLRKYLQPRRTLTLLKNAGNRKKAMIYTRTGDKGTSSVILINIFKATCSAFIYVLFYCFSCIMGRGEAKTIKFSLHWAKLMN